MAKQFVEQDGSCCIGQGSPQSEHVRSGALLDVDAVQAMSAACAYRSQALAQRLGISPRHLHRLFIASFGCSPQRWLREQRLQLALRSLLAQGKDAPTLVKEVAFTLGYQHPTQFSRDFRSRFGRTPLDAIAAAHKAEAR